MDPTSSFVRTLHDPLIDPVRRFLSALRRRRAKILIALALTVGCNVPFAPPDDLGAAVLVEDAAAELGDAASDLPPDQALYLEDLRAGGDAAPPDAGAVQNGATLCGIADVCVRPGSRDLARWPFDACSPWNHPAGTGAQYQPVSSPALWTRAGDARTTAAMNSASWSHPVYVEEARSGAADTLSGTDELGRAVSYPLMIPGGATPAVGTDAHLHLIDSGRRNVYETYQARRVGSSIVALDLVRNDLRGAGVFDGMASPQREIWHGVRAYGGSAIAGLIRKGEMLTAIPHALAVAVQRAAMNKNTPNGMGYVWPASYRDDGWKTTYGSTGNVHMGTLLVIPHQEDRQALFLRERITDPRVQVLATALQEYGAYVVDATSDNISFYAEPAEEEAERVDADQLARLLPYLRVVTNSDPAHIGGGGRPLQCFAPAAD
jgi:hypothetical protein